MEASGRTYVVLNTSKSTCPSANDAEAFLRDGSPNRPVDGIPVFDLSKAQYCHSKSGWHGKSRDEREDGCSSRKQVVKSGGRLFAFPVLAG